MKKRTLSLILAIVLTLGMLLTACGGAGAPPAASPENPAGKTEPADGVKRAAIVMRNLSDTFAAKFINDLTTQAEEYKDVFTLEVLDAQGDPEKANALIETCITQKYDLVIICPVDSELQRPYAEKLIEAGILTITTSAKIDNLEGGSTVDADPYRQGVMLSEEAVARVPQNANVVILSCQPGNAHPTARLKAIKEVFVAQRPDVTVLAEKTLEKASEAEAMATMEDWAQSYGKIDAVLTTADIVGIGALEAVKGNPDFEGMQVYGVDGLKVFFQAIIDGRATATVFQDAEQLAAYNLKAAHMLLTGQETQVDLVYSDRLINAENAEEFIDIAN